MKRGTLYHPKTGLLADVLGAPRYAAIGILAALWEWASEYAHDGEIGRWGAGAVATALGWAGDAVALMEALITTRWADRLDDGRIIIHDWPEHCDDQVHARLIRKGKTFADGTVPSKLTWLNSTEREEHKKAVQGKSKESPRKVQGMPLVPKPKPMPKPDLNATPDPDARAREDADETNAVSASPIQSGSATRKMAPDKPHGPTRIGALLTSENAVAAILGASEADPVMLTRRWIALGDDPAWRAWIPHAVRWAERHGGLTELAVAIRYAEDCGDETMRTYRGIGSPLRNPAGYVTRWLRDWARQARAPALPATPGRWATTEVRH